MSIIQFRPMGDKAMMIELGNQIDEKGHQRVRQLFQTIQQARIKGINELVPTYSGITIYYDPVLIKYPYLCEKIKQLGSRQNEFSNETTRKLIIPTCYEEEFGPDLGKVAELNHLTKDKVIQIHTEPLYLVYMLGFVPGFAYLGGMSARIATKRRSTPRAKIPRGSVGIAGEQTGIYPLTTPGGWRLIGRTPIPLFDPDQEPPILLRMGDRIQFRSITKAEYIEIEKMCQLGTYEVEIRM